jgi:hypothetical protein
MKTLAKAEQSAIILLASTGYLHPILKNQPQKKASVAHDKPIFCGGGWLKTPPYMRVNETETATYSGFRVCAFDVP